MSKTLEHPLSATKGAREPETAPSGATPLRILAVDDEPGLRRAIELVLRREGHAVRSVASGEAALAQLEAESFDLVLSDLGMPGMDGWELAARVRARWPAIGFALATGWGAVIDAEQARGYGVDAVILKPFRMAELRDAIVRLAARGTQPA
jgi:CheY-like chemotaxis protein